MNIPLHALTSPDIRAIIWCLSHTPQGVLEAPIFRYVIT